MHASQGGEVASGEDTEGSEDNITHVGPFNLYGHTKANQSWQCTALQFIESPQRGISNAVYYESNPQILH